MWIEARQDRPHLSWYPLSRDNVWHKRAVGCNRSLLTTVRPKWFSTVTHNPRIYLSGSGPAGTAELWAWHSPSSALTVAGNVRPYRRRPLYEQNSRQHGKKTTTAATNGGLRPLLWREGQWDWAVGCDSEEAESKTQTGMRKYCWVGRDLPLTLQYPL